MKRIASVPVLFCLLLIPSILRAESSPDAPSVSVWEESVTIPTYLTAPPDTIPMFYEGRTYQGAKGPVYPYPITDRLLNVREDKSYKMLYLENKYLKIGVLPELGGRIFSALDKTNNYDFFYRQHVVKPALIGMLGAWISGGVEWNVPHHHRATSFSPVAYRLESNPDGSKTVWVGEMELRHRMRWIVGLTLHPDRSYLEGTVRVFNRTPVAHSILYFANVAVHTNADYQVIFPPSTQFATQHAKREFIRWPVGDGRYAGVDYRGVDCSWWKNHPRPVSMFAHDCREAFLAGYDHGKQAGTLHVADPFTMPGKKFFTWGTGSEGQVWDQILTDTDGPYLELMVGGYSDNQPDYSWIQPYEVKTVRHCWYPFQRIGGVKNATRDAAVNLEVTPQNVAKIGFCATAEHPEANVVVRAGSKTLLDRTVAIGPGQPFLTEITVPQGVKAEELRVALRVAGQDLVAYQSVRREQLAKPSPVTPPPPPKEVKTLEELYLAGSRLEQFHSPAQEPDPYYQEAIGREPSDYRANTALGILYYDRGLFSDAEEKLEAAVRRVTENYTRPRDGEAYYYLGLARKAQGRYDTAFDAFYRATWSYAWHTAAFYALAELASQNGDPESALEFLDRSISTNRENTKAWNLKSALLRRIKHFPEAQQAASAAVALDPLDPWARRECYLAAVGTGAKNPLRPPTAITTNLHDDVQPYLEIAVDYSNAGLWTDGFDVLRELVEAYPDPGRVYPMVYYYLGWLAEKDGKAAEASRFYQLARRMPSDYCFPFRLESIAVLRRAMAVNPDDPRAPYYLGNLLYDRQPAEAIAQWEKARTLDDAFALVHRNLGLAYARVDDDTTKAVAGLEAAVSCKPDSRFLFERDQLYEAQGVPAAERLAALEKHHQVVSQRDDTLSREIRLHVLVGNYDRALALLTDRHFNVWEGGARFSVHDSYVDAHLLRGHRHLRDKEYPEALRDYEAALAYPENLSVGRPYRGDRSPQIHYCIATVHAASGNAEKATEYLQKTVAELEEGGQRARSPSGDGADVLFCQGLAFQKLGQRDRAGRIFDRLVEYGQETLKRGDTVDYFAKFGERQRRNLRMAHAHYALGLGYLGAGKPSEAKAEFEKTRDLDPNHLGATVQLAAPFE